LTTAVVTPSVVQAAAPRRNDAAIVAHPMRLHSALDVKYRKLPGPA